MRWPRLRRPHISALIVTLLCFAFLTTIFKLPQFRISGDISPVIASETREDKPESFCYLIARAQFLERPHGINNQILLYATMFLDLEWLIRTYQCKLYVQKIRIFISHLDEKNFFIPFEQMFSVRQDGVFLTEKELDHQLEQGVSLTRVTFDDLRKRNIPTQHLDTLGNIRISNENGNKNNEVTSQIMFSFKTFGLYDNSIWRWFFHGFFSRNLKMIKFLQDEITFQEKYLNIFSYVMENNILNFTLNDLEKHTLVVHLRFPPHCVSTGAEGAFGEWFTSFYICNPGFEEYVNNINEILFRNSVSSKYEEIKSKYLIRPISNLIGRNTIDPQPQYHRIERLLFLTINQSHPIVNDLMKYYSHMDPILGSWLFRTRRFHDPPNFDKSLNVTTTTTKIYYPQYIYDLIQYLMLEKSYTHLSTFISTYSLVCALRRGFVNSYFVRSFGFTFGNFGGFVLISKTLIFFFSVYVISKWIHFFWRRRKSQVKVNNRCLSPKSKNRFLNDWKKRRRVNRWFVLEIGKKVVVDGFFVCLIVLIFPVFVELGIAGGLALTKVEYVRLCRTVVKIIYSSVIRKKDGE